MKIVLIVIGIVIGIGAVIEAWSRLAYRRWRKRFDSLPPDKQRKEQERLYRAKQMGC